MCYVHRGYNIKSLDVSISYIVILLLLLYSLKVIKFKYTIINTLVKYIYTYLNDIIIM